MSDKSSVLNKQLNNCSREELLIVCQALQQQLKENHELMENMLEQIRLSQHQRYGTSSEKSKYEDGYEQIYFTFNEAELIANLDTKEPEYEEITVNKHRRKKQKGKRESDLSGFPVIKIEHKLSEEEQQCKKCTGILHDISTETYKLLKFIPAHFEVEEHHVGVYSCRDCEDVVRAPRPQTLLRGSIATPSLVAGIMNAKYANALPLNRQSEDFMRYGVNLSRQTMANWVIRCSEEYLSLIYNHMKTSLLSNDVIMVDETRVQVLKEEGRKATTESWMWVYRTGNLSNSKTIILFEYQKTRGGYHPKEFLCGFKGFLTADGYSVYHGLPPDIVVTGCWAHTKRKFNDCLKGLDPGSQKGTLANEALIRIGLLYNIEKMLADKTPEERREGRLKQSKPIIDAFFEWVETVSLGVVGNSLIEKAFNYAKNQKSYLYNYLKDGRISIDNNATERAIRPFSIGRGNWLFCDTPAGAESSAIVYSIVETAKANGLRPYDYLLYLLEEIPKKYWGTDHSFLEELLPWSDKIPTSCKSQKPSQV
ncbi:MAG TPA: IS66 family transposase [Clostridia bacterium]